MMAMWNAKRQSRRKFHPTRPVQGEVYSTLTSPRPPGCKAKVWQLGLLGKPKQSVKPLITFHWTTVMAASPGKLSS